MFAKLVLLAEDIQVDELGRISTKNLLLDTFLPSFPAKLAKVDLLTLWTRTPEESSRQMFEIVMQIDGESVHTERVLINFNEEFEAYQGISLDGLDVEKPGAIVFRFVHNAEDRAVWIMRSHEMTAAPSIVGPVGEAK
jgi:hypothetical protein